MKEQVMDKLRNMNLKGFLVAYNEQQSNSSYFDMSFEDRFSLLIEHEHLRRTNNRLTRRRSEASLAVNSSVAQIDFSHDRGLVKKQILEFENCSWVYNAKNIILTAATGCGKTYLACALADAALKKSLKAKYYKTHDLLIEYQIALDTQSVNQLMERLKKYDLIVFDEWLRDNFQLEQSRFILDLIDSRFRSKAAIFVSQLPIEKWHSRLGEPTIADAILDRIIHDSFKINLKGESMRKITADQLELSDKKV